ncbi:hypothetical protein GCM10023196_035330 [Actinoallomurus vinaceus]|uniref:Uncharacterized protein n=1 Tax=Actinoallomurus vinaceus TaxID=1080074 RepID=A0ABP8U8Y8_9ACTN
MIRRFLAAVAWLLVRPGPARRPMVDDTIADIPACAPDPSPEQLAEIQDLCRQWLVMWCRYRREFAAFALFGHEPLIICDRNRQRLLYRCRAAELEQIGAPA